ncbi:hypothetical protein ACHAXA_002629 [Cyclostephanos tholiformis]|uniref:Uncharacterized protein n=1 Tax=Cyclostephanos tholiformis TaxID=382380 RepID=A0ABD3SCR6_9STRA
MTGAIPSDMPDPLGIDADYSDHAEERGPKPSTWSSIFATGLYLTGFPLGAAFVALQYGIKRLRGLGIPLSGPSYTSGDNKSRVTDLTKPET